jgi:hypothetical protein
MVACWPQLYSYGPHLCARKVLLLLLLTYAQFHQQPLLLKQVFAGAAQQHLAL